jgi:asparagine synthase (glutamine-hydrolysing)
VGLAHRRLAVIDLTPGGRQPMTDPAGEVVIVFNGEIYNYQDLRTDLEARGRRFRSTSDTEVLLEAYRAWGTGCLDRLDGMFAFALFDRRDRRLLLARDRAGEKPLFYRHEAGRLWFASELKALLADGSRRPAIDAEALEFYLAYGYVPAPRCILRGFRKLPPGWALVYEADGDRLHGWRYWDLPAPAAANGRTADDLADELHGMLRGSVRRRLAADVPVGVLLSGGVDSSLVTAMAAEVAPSPVRTFTITFPGAGKFDEARYARLVAGHFGARHTELAAEPADVDVLPELARQYDEPIADSSMVPTYLVSRLVREHATVALGGDGGDELFGGYPQHRWVQQQAGLRRMVPGPVRSAARRIAAGLLPTGLRGRNYLLGGLSDLPESIAQVNVYFDAGLRRRLLAPGARPEGPDGRPERFKADLCHPGRTPLQLATAADFHAYLAEDILVKVDRASMLTSLEVRCPFLDHRIIEFAFRDVPDDLRATWRRRKVLLRRLAARLLPPRLDLNRKQGFTLPLDAWFRGAWGGYCERVLSEADERLFRREVIRRLIQGQRRGLSNTPRLFALTIFELWRRHYGATVAP